MTEHNQKEESLPQNGNQLDEPKVVSKLVKPYICIHGHFYQPPRENPWLGEIEVQDSARPFHNWNERITDECYGPNTASRILDSKGRITEITNNYSKISFNFGPTLLSWLQKHKPEIYDAVIEADHKSSMLYSGHGSALAQAYSHMIMPLANERDKRTQVLWGIRDFKNRFTRLPEGMWLPETAADMETLRVLAKEGILFTILAPGQARSTRAPKQQMWKDVTADTINTRRPYRVDLGGGLSISVFFYDGHIARDVAFGGLLYSGENFAKRLLGSFDSNGAEDQLTEDENNSAELEDNAGPDNELTEPELVHIATDGESYGHHHRFGDMALAYCLHYIENNGAAELTNYGEYLSMYPAQYEAAIHENSSWSCYHGIERWRSNCGCSTGGNQGWTQSWRAPLRDALDYVRDELSPYYEEECGRFLKDPWAARQDYIDVILSRTEETVEAFLKKHARGPLVEEARARVLKLIETQVNAMLMYTSCGWFFDEISGIETVQIMRYAARALRYHLELSGTSVEPEFEEILKNAHSNVLENGAVAYERFVKPSVVDLNRVAVHFAIASIFDDFTEWTLLYYYSARSEILLRKDAGRVRLITGKADIFSNLTQEKLTVCFAVLHLGDHNVSAGVLPYENEESLKEMSGAVGAAFDMGDVPRVIRAIDRFFGDNNYSLWYLFRDEQRRVLKQVLKETYEGIETSFTDIYRQNATIINFHKSLDMPIPKPLLLAAEHAINMELIQNISSGEVDSERCSALLDEARRWDVSIDTEALGYEVSRWLERHMEALEEVPSSREHMELAVEVLRILEPLKMKLSLWKSQNIYFSVGRGPAEEMKNRAATGDVDCRKWLEAFSGLGVYLKAQVL